MVTSELVGAAPVPVFCLLVHDVNTQAGDKESIG